MLSSAHCLCEYDRGYQGGSSSRRDAPPVSAEYEAFRAAQQAQKTELERRAGGWMLLVYGVLVPVLACLPLLAFRPARLRAALRRQRRDNMSTNMSTVQSATANHNNFGASGGTTSTPVVAVLESTADGRCRQH